MKRFLVLRKCDEFGCLNGYSAVECDAIGEAVAVREKTVADPQFEGPGPIIVEVIPPLEAYTMAKREAVLAEIAAATKRP